MESKNSNGKVPLISKIAYGFGDVGCNFSWMFVSNFLMIFYTDIFGISMAAVCCACHGSYTCTEFLGASGLVKYCKNHLYDYYILPAGIRLYMRQYPLWNAMRCNDTEH